jgi:hypothetical protein
MNRYSDELEELWPRMKKLSEKYPELKDESNPPEELKASQAQAKEVGMKMGQTFMKAMPYMSDPEVRKAQERMARIMGQ